MNHVVPWVILAHALLALAPACAAEVPPAPDVFISEFMADNQRTLNDEDGEQSDWIELFNASDTTASLQGWFLTDDPALLSKWRFPDVAIGARQFLLVFASQKDRTNVTGRLHTNFKLSSQGEYLALVSPETNVVSEFAPAYPPQRPDVSYGRAQGALDMVGYFTKPTPGAPNADNGPGFAPPVSFSRSSGTFSSAFLLALGSASSNAILRYTLDGSLPTNSSPAYVGPIAITNSVQVRARAFEAGLLPGPAQTEAYLLLSSNVLSFTSDLPLLIIHALGKGVPSSGRQTYANISVYEPVEGVTTLTNAPTLVTRSGIKVRGSSTEGLGKSSYALEFWDEFDHDQHREILGLPSESDWVLYAPNQFEPVLIHNPFIHQLSRDLGRYSPRTRFVEVYLNKSTGAISSLNYNGIYVLEEKIKIGPHRVDIDRLEPEHAHDPEVTGGYLLKIDRLDPGDAGFSAGGQAMAYVDPKERDLRLPQRAPQKQYIKSYFDAFGKALNGPDWLDPVKGYRAFIDVDAWIDFHVLELLSGNVDSLVLSTYFHKPRESKIVFGPHWDFDRALGSTDGRDSNPRNWLTGPFFAGWWGRLFRDPYFWQKWIDRYQELRQSNFSLANLHGLIDRLADEVRQAQPRERQKWHVALRGGTYQSEVNLMKNWLSNRLDFIDKQLVPAPVLSAPGSRVTPGFVLTITRVPTATVYYTLDGTDPRSPQGALSPQARLYTGPITVTENVRIVARARNLAQKQTGGPPISSPWSGPAAATFVVRPPPLLLTEIMFNPEPTAADCEFLELKNISAETLALAGYVLSGTVQFTFGGTGAVTQLRPGERALVVANLAAFQARYPGVTNVAGDFTGSLKSGNRLVLQGPLQEPIFDVTYDRQWQPLADGFGFSLVLADETTAPTDLNLASNWRLSAHVGGSPESADPGPAPVPHVLINELLSNPPATLRDTLELFNPTAQPAAIGGWFITDDFRKPKQFRIADDGSVAPNGFLLLDSFPTTNGSIAFSKFGEQVYLFSADAAGNLTGWFHGFRFGPSEPGVSFGRYTTSTGGEVFVPQRTVTLGSSNSGPRVGPVIINEIMSGAGASGDYVELRNTGVESVPLFDLARPTNTWGLRAAVEFDLPSTITLRPGGYLVVVGFDPLADPVALSRFAARYSSNPTATILGPWRGALELAEGTVQLIKPGEPESANGETAVPGILVEQVTYTSSSPWPINLASEHLALSRRDPTAFSDDPDNWMAVLPSPGDADSDGDGLPDWWELRFGLNPDSADGDDGANGDPDHDGFTNRQELLSGTGPRDAASHLNLKLSIDPDKRVRLEFQAMAGRSYRLEFRDTVTGGEWQLFQNVTPSVQDRTATILDTPAGATRFYRLTIP